MSEDESAGRRAAGVRRAALVQAVRRPALAELREVMNDLDSSEPLRDTVVALRARSVVDLAEAVELGVQRESDARNWAALVESQPDIVLEQGAQSALHVLERYGARTLLEILRVARRYENRKRRPY